MSTVRQNQIIAVVQGKKSRAQKALTEAHHGWHKDAISGISKTYEPKDVEGDRLPPESKLVHLNVKGVARDALVPVEDWWNAVATQ